MFVNIYGVDGSAIGRRPCLPTPSANQSRARQKRYEAMLNSARQEIVKESGTLPPYGQAVPLRTGSGGEGLVLLRDPRVRLLPVAGDQRDEAVPSRAEERVVRSGQARLSCNGRPVMRGWRRLLQLRARLHFFGNSLREPLSPPLGPGNALAPTKPGKSEFPKKC